MVAPHLHNPATHERDVLRGGDRLQASDGRLIEVAAAPEQVSIVHSGDVRLLARAAYHLGNRHVAVQITADSLRFLRGHRRHADELLARNPIHPAVQILTRFAMSIPTRLRLPTLASLLLASLAPAAALAHPGHAAGEDFAAGLVHPLSGLDHLLMIIVVSAWAARFAPTGRAIVTACLALFVGLGALLPLAGGSDLEVTIALTVIAAGILLARGRRWPLWATASLAGLFALIHGFAHGIEGSGRSASYIAGLVLATAALALAVKGLVARLRDANFWTRSLGVLGAVAGAAALLAH